MAFETSSYASSSSQSNDAPKELLQLLGVLNKQQQQQQQQQHRNRIKLPHQQEEQQQIQMQQQQHVELSQIELIYRAEGNANLVLALPQFKKVLRLPKTQQKQQQIQQQQQQQRYADRNQFNQNYPQQNKQQRRVEQHELKQQEPTDMTLTATTGQHQEQKQEHRKQQHNENAVGILTMDHYVAYIGIIRCLLGNEFVFEADVVAVPNPNDRDWINEHIRPYRPVNRLDKEFGGHYGLLLPDATGLPAEFDILFSNLQPTTTTQSCTRHVDPAIAQGGGSNIFGDDTYAIEIKPKQGWLLPNDVNNLFDLKPTTTAPTCEVSMPPAAVSSTSSSHSQSEEPLKISTNQEYLTGTQREVATAAPPSPTPPASPPPLPPPTAKTTTRGSMTTTFSSFCSAASGSTSTAAKGNDKKSPLSHDMGDIRCRYCSMQHLKLKQEKINKVSEYCPMDLFSGDFSRMIRSLDALFMCPQNNLRIFKNGILIYDDKINRQMPISDIFSSDKLQIVKHLLLSCLLRDFAQQEQGDIMTQDNVETVKEVEEVVNILSASGRKVAKVEPHSGTTSCKRQKINICSATAETEATKVNTSGLTTTTTTATQHSHSTHTCAFRCSAATCHSNCCECPCTTGDVSVGQMNTPEIPTLPKNCVLQRVLHLQLLAERNFQYMLDHNYQVKKEKSFDILRKLLKLFAGNSNKLDTSQLAPEQQYLLAATALDCSTMITFRALVPWGGGHSSLLLQNPHVICVNDQKFITKVTLLDLDPKPDSHFAKYFQQTKEIAEVLN